jgi:hypothetical protein
MLKLLLVTLGTWSVVSLFLVGAFGFLIHFREQRTCATDRSIGEKWRNAGGHIARINRGHALATRRVR